MCTLTRANFLSKLDELEWVLVFLSFLLLTFLHWIEMLHYVCQLQFINQLQNSKYFEFLSFNLSVCHTVHTVILSF